jgi:hypothetical protein
MIAEYTLEPEMVATLRERRNYKFFLDAFSPGSGRVVTFYPVKTWLKRIRESFTGDDNEEMLLTELLQRLKEVMVKRKDIRWDGEKTWMDNVLLEYERHPFHAILAKNNHLKRPEIIEENMLYNEHCPVWDNPHSVTVARDAKSIAKAVREMLTLCRWAKFIDPYIGTGRNSYRDSLVEFFSILFDNRPVGLLERVELHTTDDDKWPSPTKLQDLYGKIIPVGSHVMLYQWEQRAGGPALHNRYILTDLGGVEFSHGLDTGSVGETDDITRLTQEQYNRYHNQYNPETHDFDPVGNPIKIKGV